MFVCKKENNIKKIEGEKITLTKEVMLTKEELDALKELVELYPDTFFQGTPSMEKKLATNVLKNL